MDTRIFYIIFIFAKLVKGQQYRIQKINPTSNASSECYYGTPSILSDGRQVNLTQEEIIQGQEHLAEGFKMMLGFAEVFEIFVYKGCTEVGDMQASFNFVTKDLGRCFSFCHSDSATFGMMGSSCYCNVRYAGLGSCDNDNVGTDDAYETCERPIGALCGNTPTKIALYEKGRFDPNTTCIDENDDAKLCQAVKFEARQKNVICRWQDCSKDENTLCKPADKGNDVGSWIESVNECFDRNSFPETEIPTAIQNNGYGNKDYWLARIRGKVITVLKSVTPTTLGPSLTTTGNPGNGNNDFKVAVYIIVPILIVIIVVILVLVIWRKRNANSQTKYSPSIDNKERYHGQESHATNNPVFEHDDDGSHAYHILQPTSVYATINDNDCGKGTGGVHGHTEAPLNMPRNMYDRIQHDKDVYNVLNEKPAINTGTYNRLNEVATGQYNTLNGLTKAKIVNAGNYNTLETTASKTGAGTSNTGIYNTLNEKPKTKALRSGTYNTLNVVKLYNKETCGTINTTTTPNEESRRDKMHYPDTRSEFAVNDPDTPHTGQYYILEKQ